MEWRVLHSFQIQSNTLLLSTLLLSLSTTQPLTDTSKKTMSAPAENRNNQMRAEGGEEGEESGHDGDEEDEEEGGSTSYHFLAPGNMREATLFVQQHGNGNACSTMKKYRQFFTKWLHVRS